MTYGNQSRRIKQNNNKNMIAYHHWNDMWCFRLPIHWQNWALKWQKSDENDGTEPNDHATPSIL